MKRTFRILFLLLLAFAFTTVAFAQDEIEIGDSVDGEADGEVVEYEIELEEGDSIVISLESDSNGDGFDTFLRVLDEDDDEVATDDDGGDGVNSRLEFTAEDDGTYIIVVDAFGGEDNAEGDFELTVEALDGDDDDDDDDSSSGDADLEFGDEIDFDVDGDDELEVTFEAEDGDVVTIIARSDDDQDLTITLLDPDDDDVAIFDEFTFGAAVLIRIPLEDDGLYTIVIEERNGEELTDEVEVELIETEVLDLGDGEQEVEIDSGIGVDYMVFEAEEDVVYLIEVFLDGDIDSGLDFNIFEEDDDSYFAPVSVGVTGVEEAAFIFEATDDGLVTLELEYFAFFDGEIEVRVVVSIND